MRFRPILADLHRVTVILAMLDCLPALAQEGAPPPVEKLERIEVVGSNITRVEGEGMLPVTVIHRDEIERSGATRLSELLWRLPYFGASNLNDVSAPVSPYSGAASVSLRGLVPSATLVLLNGRRVVSFGVAILGGNGNSFVNVNDIPMAAIDRIEVLRDGASAIYGADAVAGVINVVLRNDYRGAETQAMYGVSSENDRRKLYLASTAGLGDLAVDGFNVFASGEYLHQQPLSFVSRPFSRSADHRHQGGFDLRDPFSFPPTVHFPDGRSQAGPGCPPDRTIASLGQSECVFDYGPYELLSPTIDRVTALLVANRNLPGGTRAFMELMFGRTRTADQSRPASVLVDLPATAPTNLFGTAVTLSWQPTLDPRPSQTTIDVGRVVSGLRGYLGAWDWEAAIGYNRSTSSDQWRNELRQSTLQRSLNDGLLNPFIAANDAAAFDAVTVGGSNTFTSDLAFAQVKATSELAKTNYGPLILALGFERRRESVRNALDPLLIVGDIGSDGLGPIEQTSGARDISALYGELNWAALRTLEVQLALRRDQYRGLGGATSPKLALRWQPVDAFLARASVGKGFLAPTLFQTNAPRISFYDIITDQRRCPVTSSPDDCMRPVLHVLLGNPNLQPERSRQFNVGIVWEPKTDNFIGLDFWRIDLSDKILFGGSFILDHEAAFPGRVVRAPPGSSDTASGLPGPILLFNDIYLNLAQANAQGVDLNVRGHWKSESTGRFTFDATASYQLTYSARYTPDSADVELAGTDGFPRTRATATLLWQRSAWECSVTANFIGGYRYREFVTGGPRSMASWTTLDTQATWVATTGDSLMLRVQNLTGREPPFRADDPTGFDSFVHDPVGRFVTLTWRHAFR